MSHLPLKLSLAGAVAVLWVMPASAQRPVGDVPTSNTDLKSLADQARKDTVTSTAVATDAPEEGPGSRIPPEEAQPPRPPTAAEIDAADASRDGQIDQMTKELEYYNHGTESFAADMRDLIRARYNEQKDIIAAQYDRAIE